MLGCAVPTSWKLSRAGVRQRVAQGLSGVGGYSRRRWWGTSPWRALLRARGPRRSRPAEGATPARSVCGPGLSSDHHTGWTVQPEAGLESRARCQGTEPQGGTDTVPGHSDRDGTRAGACPSLCVLLAPADLGWRLQAGQVRALGPAGTERVLGSARRQGGAGSVSRALWGRPGPYPCSLLVGGRLAHRAPRPPKLLAPSLTRAKPDRLPFPVFLHLVWPWD